MTVEGVWLAIESATSRLSVALRTADGEVLERRPTATGHHAEALLPLVDGLLSEVGLAPDALEAIAVSIGPGSFTSLRVGLSTAKGLAFGSDCRLVAVPTLEALAWGARESGDERPIAALLDARRGDLYAAAFSPDAGGLRELVPDGLFAASDLPSRLPPDCRLVGEGAALLAVDAEARDACKRAGLALETDEETRWPRATSVVEIALSRAADAADPGVDLAPRYVRRAEAEAKRMDQAVEDPH